METWYEVWRATGAITPWVVIRHTNKSLYLFPKETRVSINSRYAAHFPTLAGAVQYARAVLEHKAQDHLRMAAECKVALHVLRCDYPAEFGE